MKNPNGYGSITKLSGKRRKPFWVRSAKISYVEDGKVKSKRQTIGYYATQKEAIRVLAEYNENPYALDQLTVEDAWNKAKLTLKNKQERIDKLDSVFNKHFVKIKGMDIKNVKTEHLQDILDSCSAKSSTKDNMHTVMRHIYDYAISHDYVVKDYSKYTTYIRDKTEIVREVFTSDQVDKLWARSGTWYYDYILILLYTGCRFSEIADNKVENVDLENDTIYIPEEVAKNNSSERIIPIHKKIKPLLRAYLGSKYVFERNGYKVNYKNFYGRELKKINEYLGTDHKFHDTRHTFSTVMRELKVDLLYVDELLGHTHHSITDDVYNHIPIERLAIEINKLDYSVTIV